MNTERATRTIRNSTAAQAASNIPARRDPTIYDFILLALRIENVNDHQGGHRVNTVLRCGSVLIGKGASFAVSKIPTSNACNGSHHPFVAIKSILASSKSTEARSRIIRDAYLELQILSHPRLRKHRNILDLYGISWEPNLTLLEAFQRDGETRATPLWPVLVAEHAPSGSLAEIFDDAACGRGVPLTLETKAAWCLDVARGLTALHAIGIVHGDIKPANVLVAHVGTRYAAKLGDFSCAINIAGEGASAAIKGFTEPWEAPELHSDNATRTWRLVDIKATDVYSYGLLVWSIFLDGKNPFETPRIFTALQHMTVQALKEQEDLHGYAFKSLSNSGMWGGRSGDTFKDAEEAHNDLSKKARSSLKDGLVRCFRAHRHTRSRSPLPKETSKNQVLLDTIFENTLRKAPRQRFLARALAAAFQLQNGTCEIHEPEKPETRDGLTSDAAIPGITSDEPDAISRCRQIILRDAYRNVPVEYETAVAVDVQEIDFSDPKQYMRLVGTAFSMEREIFETFKQSLESAFSSGIAEGKKNAAAMVFAISLEVDHDSEKAAHWLLQAARAGHTPLQAIAFRLLKTLDQPLTNKKEIKQWLWNGAIRGSPVAMKDLEQVDRESAEEAKRSLCKQYGGIGIDILDGYEKSLRMFAYSMKEEDSDEDSDYDDIPSGQVVTVQIRAKGWPGEILKGVGHNRTDLYSPERGDLWEPEWRYQASARTAVWPSSRSDEAAIALAFRIMEEDGKHHLAPVSALSDGVLHYAASRGFIQLLRFIYERFPLDLDATNAMGETPLLMATRAGHVEVAAYLIELGADSSKSSQLGENPLHWVWMLKGEEKKDVIARMIADGASRCALAFYPRQLQLAFGKVPQIMGYSPPGNVLQWALYRDDRDTLAQLLTQEFGTEQDEKKALRDAIQTAAVLFSASCLETLLAHYKSVTKEPMAPDFLYSCTKTMVISNEGGGQLGLLLRQGSQWIEAFRSTFDLLRAEGLSAMQNGEDWPSSDMMQQFTCLWGAISRQTDARIIQYMLECGWDSELHVEVFSNNLLPIETAIATGQYDCFCTLLAHGADPLRTYVHSVNGKSTMIDMWNVLAFGPSKDVRLAQKLLEIGVPFQETAESSPFEIAVRKHKFELADFLFANFQIDLDREVTNEDAFLESRSSVPFDEPMQLTLLGALLVEGSWRALPAIRYLLQLSPQPSFIVSKEFQWTAMHAAVQCDPREYDEFSTSQLLPPVLEAFSEPEYIDARDKHRKASPLWWAVHAGNVKAVEILLAHPGICVMAPHQVVELPHRYVQDLLEWMQSSTPNELFNGTEKKNMEIRLMNIINLIRPRVEMEKGSADDVIGEITA